MVKVAGNSFMFNTQEICGSLESCPEVHELPWHDRKASASQRKEKDDWRFVFFCVWWDFEDHFRIFCWGWLCEISTLKVFCILWSLLDFFHLFGTISRSGRGLPNCLKGVNHGTVCHIWCQLTWHALRSSNQVGTCPSPAPPRWALHHLDPVLRAQHKGPERMNFEFVMPMNHATLIG